MAISAERTTSQVHAERVRLHKAYEQQVCAALGSLAVARATVGDAVFVAWIDLARGALVSILEDDEGLFGPSEGPAPISA